MQIPIVFFLFFLTLGSGGCSVVRSAVMAEQTLNVFPTPQNGAIVHFSSRPSVWTSPFFGVAGVIYRVNLPPEEALRFCHKHLVSQGWEPASSNKWTGQEWDRLIATRESGVHGKQNLHVEFEADPDHIHHTLVIVQLTEDFFHDEDARQMTERYREIVMQEGVPGLIAFIFAIPVISSF